MKENHTLEKLRSQFPFPGTVTWIGLRPARKAPLEAVAAAELSPDHGLVGDHYRGRSGKRQLTLINEAHLQAAAQCLARERLDPALVRRNIVISGCNLRALKGHRFLLGEAVLEYTDECHPCSRMEQVLGPGGYNAMRGHGGICARVVQAGRVAVGDCLTVETTI